MGGALFSILAALAWVTTALGAARQIGTAASLPAFRDQYGTCCRQVHTSFWK
jgi:hypothetical protein